MKRVSINNILNKRQEKSIKDSAYPSYLQAGAGSGKTRVLVDKIIYTILNEPNISLDNFAIITFTNKAADELTARLETSLYEAWLSSIDPNRDIKLRHQISIYGMTNISTIHKFCEHLLRRHGMLIGIPNTFTIKSFHQEAKEIIENQVNQFTYDNALHGIAKYKIVDLVIELLQRNSAKGLTIDHHQAIALDFNTPDNDFFNNFKQIFLQIYIESEKKIAYTKMRTNIFTPDDLIHYAVVLLDNPKITKRIASQYKYVFMDEFQDTNFEQYLLVEKMIRAGVKVFLIGDNKQSIYAFRGADVANLDRIKSLLKASNLKNLNVNYRTDPKLLDIINKIFASDFSYENTHINFPHQVLKSGAMSDLCNEPFKIEYEKNIVSIVCDIMDTVKIGDRYASFDDIAILCRRNVDVDALGRQLKSVNIPVETVGGKGFYRSKEIIDTFKLLNAIICRGDSAILESRNTFYYRALMQSYDDTSFDDFIKQLSFAFKSLPVKNGLSLIYDKSHAIEYLLNRKQFQAVANLMKLKDKVTTLTRSKIISPLEFLEQLDMMITSGKDEDEAEIFEENRINGAISLYSIHKAKGLEFPIVIIPNCDLQLVRDGSYSKIIYDNAIPSIAVHGSILGRNSSIEDKDYASLYQQKLKLNLEEELRIFYVACTRAKNMLMLSCEGSLEAIQKSKEISASWAKWVLDSQINEEV